MKPQPKLIAVGDASAPVCEDGVCTVPTKPLPNEPVPDDNVESTEDRPTGH